MTASWACLRFDPFDACSAGDAIIGFPCETRSEQLAPVSGLARSRFCLHSGPRIMLTVPGAPSGWRVRACGVRSAAPRAGFQATPKGSIWRSDPESRSAPVLLRCKSEMRVRRPGEVRGRRIWRFCTFARRNSGCFGQVVLDLRELHIDSRWLRRGSERRVVMNT